MADRSIPPTPHNYRIWYEYAAGWNPDLTREIDRLIASGEGFPPAVMERLHLTHCTPLAEEQALTSTSHSAESTIQYVIKRLGEAMERHADASSTLEGLSGDLVQLSKDGRDHQIDHVLHRILDVTRSIVDENHELNERLTQSAGELEEARRKLDQAKRESRMDALTGLANRRMFDAELRRESHESNQEATPLSLIMIDVDHFKRFNDTFGHRVGDEVLRLLAKVLMQQIKGRDTAARYGGEEFALILPDTPIHGARTVAEQVRKTLAGRGLVNRETGESFGKVTVSAGVAIYRPGEPLDGFVHRADEALYRAKLAGRNRCEAECDRPMMAAG